MTCCEYQELFDHCSLHSFSHFVNSTKWTVTEVTESHDEEGEGLKYSGQQPGAEESATRGEEACGSRLQRLKNMDLRLMFGRSSARMKGRVGNS